MVQSSPASRTWGRGHLLESSSGVETFNLKDCVMPLHFSLNVFWKQFESKATCPRCYHSPLPFWQWSPHRRRSCPQIRQSQVGCSRWHRWGRCTGRRSPGSRWWSRTRHPRRSCCPRRGWSPRIRPCSPSKSCTQCPLLSWEQEESLLLLGYFEMWFIHVATHQEKLVEYTWGKWRYHNIAEFCYLSICRT